MSFLDAASFTRSWSFLPIFNELDDDPYRSRNTIAQAQQAYHGNLFQESKFKHVLGEGAVFKVSLYCHQESGQCFAVKKAKLGQINTPRSSGKKSFSAGIFSAFKEIQVVSHAALKSHPNVVDIIGWDWASDQTPVIFVEYSELGSLQQFLLSSNTELKSGVRRSLALDIASGLQALYASDVAHGDVKLANTLVFLDSRQRRTAKISDFSHSIFGISLRRKSSYPGSGLYNAPEIRKRDSVITSDRLPACEVFSFGLLVWEMLIDGRPFYTCLPRSNPVDPHNPSDLTSYLDEFSHNGLLNIALSSIPSAIEMSNTDKATFYQVLNMTLKDKPGHRKDMQVVASALDHTDRAVILHFSSGIAMSTISVWDFNPWDDLPWVAKEEFVEEIKGLVEGPVQPNHAELHQLLSRCYAEGYGVITNAEEAVKHLYLAAQEDSVDASCFIEMCQPYLASLPRPHNLRLSSNAVTKALHRIQKEKERAWDTQPLVRAEYGVEYFEPIGYVRLWNLEDREFVQSRPFSRRVGDQDSFYDWSDEGVWKFYEDTEKSGVLICDAVISYQTILNPLNTANFYEVCATYGRYRWLEVALSRIRHHEDYANTSWGTHQEVWERLLNKAAQGGQYHILKSLLKRVTGVQGAGVSERQWGSPTGESPLHYLSLIDGNDDDLRFTIQCLLKLGLSIDTPITTRKWLAPYGLEIYGTPMQMAVRSKCLQVVKVLAEFGADLTLAYKDSPTPLALAVSLHSPSVVELLLSLTRFSTDQRINALNMIGVPSRKGWFERVMRMSNIFRPSLKQYLAEIASKFSLTPRKLSQGCIQPKNAESILLQMDGTSIIEAIRRGQRDSEVIASMLELGFGPSSMNGRFNLMKELLTLGSKNPLRNQLLHLVLCMDNSRAANVEISTKLWYSGWQSFLVNFRCADEAFWKMTVLQCLVAQGDIEALRLLKQLFPGEFSSLKVTSDENNDTPVDLAIDRGSSEIYWLLTIGAPRDKRKDVERAEKTMGNRILEVLLAEAAKQEEQAELANINNLMNSFINKSYFLKYQERIILAGALENLGLLIEKHSAYSQNLYPAQKAEDMYMTGLHLRLSGLHRSENRQSAFNTVRRLPPSLRGRYRSLGLPKPNGSSNVFVLDPTVTEAAAQFRLDHLRNNIPSWIKDHVPRIRGLNQSSMTGALTILYWIGSGQFRRGAEDVWQMNSPEVKEFPHNCYEQLI